MLPTLLSLLLATPPCLAQPLRVRVTVASDRWKSLTPGIQQAMERAWRPAGLVIEWTESGEGWAGVDFWIALLPGMRLRGVIGSVSFVGSQPQPLARVSIDQVLAIARQHQAELLKTSARVLETGALDDGRLVSQILSFAAAHELGHFVLATKKHSASGIMMPGVPRLSQLDSEGAWQLDASNQGRLKAIANEACGRKPIRAAIR